ncbi:PREDICTED: uncharacterized protein LOC105456513 [Wasmannia auropunctata]|uniref:uncharacterized protein LOC105456513 n=1 Tax=Wasmannia auropunctata TaxID=64793 RepID=UPI0005EF38DF|nr:PREDICTED: uncharacterized protein LOC105456513 [Wasmannia auropunctata]
MKKATINTLMIFIFASQVLQIFGNVTVLRSSLLSKNATSVKLICVSEDDGGALVWNYNLIDKFYYSKNHNSEFYDDSNNNTINCKMNATEGCLKSWTKDNWTFTNSLVTPMGPVLDQRWEEFEELILRSGFLRFNGTHKNIYNHVITNINITKLTFSFSVRTFNNVHILFCNDKDNNKDSCYWIVIGDNKNTRSVIKKCETGMPLGRVQKMYPMYLAMYSKCKALDSFTHKPLSVNEWQTFVITWDFVMQKITVYDTDKIIMTYTDEEKLLYSRNEYNHILIGSDAAMLLRFHTYNFLYTTVENASLTSPIFHFNNETICVQLLIGLCAECLAYVELRDSVNYKLLKTFIAKGSPKALGLSMWQSVKIETNLTNYNNYGAIIQLIPKLNDKHSSNPLWAIANVRQCLQSGNLKRNVIEVDLNSYTRMNMTCQKLFYDEYAVVNSTSHDKSDVNLGNY